MPGDGKRFLRLLTAFVIFAWGLILGTAGTCFVLPMPLDKRAPDVRPDMGAFMDQGWRIGLPIGAAVGLLLAVVYLIVSRRRSG